MVATATVNNPSCAGCPPLRVGVSPGTTTMLLTGPTAPADPVVGCENPDRAARQRYLLFPPGKFVQMAGEVVQQAATMIKDSVAGAVAMPYETLESLKGIKRRGLRGLGLVLSPYGDQSPNPSYQLVAATKSLDYCTRRPERGPNYRQETTAAYEPEGRHHGINGLGAVPTDIQLSSQFTYTPVVSQWIPFTSQTWSPAPWNPPSGPTSTMPQDQGYWTAPTAGPMSTIATGQPLNQYLGGFGATTPSPPILDPASAAVEELRRQQDRTYLLGIISAAAVASTAIVNLFRYHNEKRDRRTRHTRVDAEPAPMISGVRRRRRRRH